ncbi:unnamed protein product, partial [Schistosoma rodhaini]
MFIENWKHAEEIRATFNLFCQYFLITGVLSNHCSYMDPIDSFSYMLSFSLASHHSIMRPHIVINHAHKLSSYSVACPQIFQIKLFYFILPTHLTQSLP